MISYLADKSKTIQLAEDDIVKVRYDVDAMKWIPSRPSRIRYQTAKQLIQQYRREYQARLKE